LFNLIQNSIKYAKQEGMIEITISLEKKMQSRLLDSPDYQFVTKIKDNGKKIDKNRIDYLFLTFGELRKL
jgi:signal transduction histidine kinase